MKTEPSECSFESVYNNPNHTVDWFGIRNYQARNFMRDDMKVGDLGFFYHSGKTPEIAGLVEVVREGYPDHTAQDPEAGHFDPAATPENPRWYMVDVRLVKRFTPPISRTLLRRQAALQGMELLKQGSRLSVLPCEEDAFVYIRHMAEELEKDSGKTA